LEKTARVQRPVIVGVLPLHNYRHAVFLHQEVPGMYLPDSVRDRMRRAGEEGGPAEGQAMARDFIALCRAKAAGVFLVPSFGRYDIVAELVAEAKG
ncbi:MAG: bifunctional homocysteine S-methyltransferase/methylenetetrahydrofolate reductase, partial [Chloroflexi bacterium]|nr:bifunctional homocysteine S-methyltransferase/methylenetetrahydrofolate reductase [Chloroflexota bacterium]